MIGWKTISEYSAFDLIASQLNFASNKNRPPTNREISEPSIYSLSSCWPSFHVTCRNPYAYKNSSPAVGLLFAILHVAIQGHRHAPQSVVVALVTKFQKRTPNTASLAEYNAHQALTKKQHTKATLKFCCHWEDGNA